MGEVRERGFLTRGRLVGAALLYVLLAIVPSAPLETARVLVHLLATDPPDRVAVPVDGVPVARLRDSWGQPRAGGRRHEGIDLFAPRGTRIVASVEGLVWRIGTDPLGGRVVWLLGPGGQMHYFAHLDRYSEVRVGDHVAVGTTLGYVGTTGNARGGPPHLHYGIYAPDAGAIDPYPLLIRGAGCARPDATDVACSSGTAAARPRPGRTAGSAPAASGDRSIRRRRA